MKPEVLSRWLPILRFIQANPYATPRIIAGHFNVKDGRATPMGMFSTIRNMREAGLLKRAKRGFAGYYLTEKAKKLLAN